MYQLRTFGWSYRKIAKKAGLSFQRIWQILNKDPETHEKNERIRNFYQVLKKYDIGRQDLITIRKIGDTISN
jgi:transcriptional regulator with XRE-family HTH domain